MWSFGLEASEPEVVRCSSCLSTNEQTRAAAFRRPQDRVHYVVAHAALRERLAGYLGCAPAALGFRTGPHGKPELGEGFPATLRYNLSHSGGRALLAVARGCEVGVDLEQMNRDVDMAGVVATHFSATEQRTWAALPPSQKPAGFFHGWVRKEAYVKARGEGLLRNGAAYTVELDPARPAALLADVLVPDAPAHWRIEGLEVAAGFAAALAYAGPVRRVVVREL
ncbi:4'-phosphopantetheinyl transferase [Opitutus terrae PB90-1]|uniref:4'-phosphopantetheinyl transferase n=2 Tax=Opitutus terrae TaxID=107709 RepID=B1ZYL1_OPITP|nr:4'-phosphopantetheinyl transferase [Opitutus terrae PB90-1]